MVDAERKVTTQSMKRIVTQSGRAKKNQPERAFTFVELLVVIAVLAILIIVQGQALAVNNRGKSKAMQCLENVREINMATTLFAQENGCYPHLYRTPSASGWPAWTYIATNFVVQNPNALFWQDALRLGGFVRNPRIFSCPQLTLPGSTSIGGAFSTNSALGIGMNYPEIGMVASGPIVSLPPKLSDVKDPSHTVIFGDSGNVMVATANEPTGDGWMPDNAYGAVPGGSTYFRAPTDPNFVTGDARMLPRHDGRVVAGWGDGGVALIKNSQIGWRYPAGDARALWNR
jgi:prepilin-type N-terminal cleavage/methylation domain-containing protein